MPSIAETYTQKQLRMRSEAFFSEILSRIAEGKHPRILPRGSSMRPFIRGGADTIVLSPLEEDSFQVGRIVLAHIDRGYDNLVAKLKGIGANIVRVDE